MTFRPWVLVAGLNGGMAVAFAAYATHGIADPHAQALAERAWQFQLLHALALLAADRLAAEGRRAAVVAASLFTLGIVLFSGSLLWKALAGPIPVPLVTPAGGIAFMLGWVALAVSSRV
jgi:uncharacterized membrane protein YgdD (TMEM256/DUF423 family)